MHTTITLATSPYELYIFKKTKKQFWLAQMANYATQDQDPSLSLIQTRVLSRRQH